MRHPAAALLLVLSLACTTDEPATELKRFAALPVARTEVAGTLWTGRIVVVGGYLADGSSTAQVDAYEDGRWTRLPDLPAQVNHSGVAVLDGRLYVAGGFSPTAKDTSVWSLGAGDTSWRVEPPLAHGRAAHALVSTGTKLYAVGGVHGRDLVADVDVLERGAQGWMSGGRLRHPREHLAAAAVLEHVYVIGGRVGGPGGNRRTVEIRDPDGTWRAGPDLVTARGGIGAAVLNGTLVCVTGGETPLETIGSIECLWGDRWYSGGKLDVPRHGLAVVAVDNVLHVIAGGAKPGLFVSDKHEGFVVDTEARRGER